MNIKNVLVPVDFSPPSRLAVNYGVSLARKFRAKLTLMHVVESFSGLVHPFTDESGPIAQQHREQSLRMLGALVGSEDQDDLDLRIVTKSGNVKDEITAVVQDQGADILVMGTHSRGLFGRWFVGSVTEGVLRRVSVPVLTVCRATKPLSFSRILLATDLSESSERGFEFALELARLMRSDLIILHALDQTPITYAGAEMVSYVSERDIEEAKSKLAELAFAAGRANVRTQSIVVQGVAAEEILRAAERDDADLILVSIGKKGVVERALLGTTAERVIREATVPVLSIPPLPEAKRHAIKAGLATSLSKD